MRTAQTIKTEIIEKFGFFPPFFEPALTSPLVLENLWQQTLSAYLNNPLPDLFKEKLAALLARYCMVPYCLLCHSSSLRPLGMSSVEILELLQAPALTFDQLSERTKALSFIEAKPPQWPKANSELEDYILHCSVAVFLNQDSEKCLEKLRAQLGAENYDYLLLFIAYNRTCLQWAEGHPEIAAEADLRVQQNMGPLLAEEPALKNFFENYQSKARQQEDRRSTWLSAEYRTLLGAEKQIQVKLKANERLLQALVAESTSAIAVMRGPELTFELVNKKWTELVSPREYIGRRYADVYPELKDTEAHKSHTNIFVTGIPFTAHEMKLTLKSPAGFMEEQYYDYSNVRILDDQDEPYGVYCNASNVTERVQQRNRLQESTRDVIDNLESMSDAFFSIDKNWTITRVNENMKKLTRVSDLVGKNILDLFFADPSHKTSNFWIEYHRAMNDRVPVSFEEYYPPLDFWLAVRAFPKADGGLSVFFTDITNEKKVRADLKESSTNFQSITEATPLIVWTAAPNGDVTFANSKWYAFSGLTKEETLGTGFTSIIHPDDIQHTLTVYSAALQSHQPLEIEHRFKQASDGVYRWFLTRALPAFDETGKVTNWFGTNVDIHDQKLVAEELLIAKSEAERANEIKSSFLANMSHEIRTPLGAIIGFSEMLGEDSLDRADSRSFAEIISRNAKALTRIIDDILDLSKVEAGRLDIELLPMSLKTVLDDVLELFTDRAKAMGLALQLNVPADLPAKIESDAIRIRQILVNIIGNAIKFTERGSVVVAVAVEKSTGQERHFKISVKDTGRGLTQEQIGRLFQPFSQADNTTTREFGGTGLGLVLSLRLANALGGNVEIESAALGQGSTFTISFTANALNETPQATTPLEQKNRGASTVLKDVKILLIEDSPDNQLLIKRILIRNGATVVLAENGYQGVNRALEEKFDLVLMDIQMPLMDGYEAIAKLKNVGYNSPIIALTAHAMEEERLHTHAAGFAAHVTKPIEFSVLIQTISDVLSSARAGLNSTL